MVLKPSSHFICLLSDFSSLICSSFVFIFFLLLSEIYNNLKPININLENETLPLNERKIWGGTKLTNINHISTN